MFYRNLLCGTKDPYLPRNQFYVNSVSHSTGSCTDDFRRKKLWYPLSSTSWMKKKGLLKFNHLLVNPQSTKITFICGTLVAVMIFYYYVKLLRIHVRKCVKNAPKLESRGGKYICMYVVSSLLKKASLALTSDKMKALELQT